MTDAFTPDTDFDDRALDAELDESSEAVDRKLRTLLAAIDDSLAGISDARKELRTICALPDVSAPKWMQPRHRANPHRRLREAHRHSSRQRVKHPVLTATVASNNVTVPTQAWGDRMMHSVARSLDDQIMSILDSPSPRIRRLATTAVMVPVLAAALGTATATAEPTPPPAATDRCHTFAPGADLHNCNLHRAHLAGTDLHGANLDSANLDSANLDSANLDSANLTNANLTNADLTNAHLTNAHLTNAHLTNAHLTGAYLHGANLHGANLDSANLDSANLDSANLDSADLERAEFSRTNLRGANLTRAHAPGTGFADANLRDATITDWTINFFTVFRGATWTDGKRCAFPSQGACN